MSRRLIVLVVLFFLIACASASKLMPKEENLAQMQQKVPGITLEKAQNGFNLYKEKCSGCHQLYRPSKYSMEQWDAVLLKMFPKAKIRDEETKGLIRDYLHALSK